MTAEALRSRVVLLVVVAIAVLTFGLYAEIGLLLWAERAIPGELWLAAGTFGGALVTILVNSKGGAEGGAGTVTEPTTVTAPPESTVRIDPPPTPEEHV